MDSQEQNSSYRQILKYTSLFGSIQGINILIALVRNKIVAVLLGPSVMGLMSLFYSTIQMMFNATNLGIGTSSVKTLSELVDQGEEERLVRHVGVIRSWAMLTAIGGMLVSMLLVPLLSRMSFSDGNHELHLFLLTPAVALMAIAGGEMAVLKATRQLKNIARFSMLNMAFTLLAALLLFYFIGEAAIVPYLVSVALAQMVLTMIYSVRLYPYRLSFSGSVLREGKPMVKLGLAFVAAGVCTSGADFAIRAILNKVASLEIVGLYNSGVMMTVVYAGMVFSAFETDFFPRLSQVNQRVDESNLLVNRQIEVTMHILSPMLIVFSMGMPLFLPLLFSRQFLPVLSMIQVTTLSMFIRGVKLPAAYLMLGKGDSRAFFWMELYSAVVLVLAVVGGYLLWGLLGTGIGILLTEALDILVVNALCRLRYHYQVSTQVMRAALFHLPLQVLCLFSTQFLSDISYWAAGLVLFVISLWISLHFFFTQK